MNAQLMETMATVSLFVTLVLGLLKPLIESLGVVKSLSAEAHDALLRLLGYALNFGLLVAMLASQGTLDFGHQWYAYLAAALGQQIVSHASYKVVRGASSSATSAVADVAEDASVPVLDPSATAEAVASAVGAELTK